MYRIRVKKTDLKQTLWNNIATLMRERYGGKENLTRMATECGIGAATVARLKEGSTSVGLDLIEQIANCFGVKPWQLLVPDIRDWPDMSPVTRAIALLMAAHDDPVRQNAVYARVIQLLGPDSASMPQTDGLIGEPPQEDRPADQDSRPEAPVLPRNRHR